MIRRTETDSHGQRSDDQ